MRTFPHFNAGAGLVCPICGMATDAETVLIPIARSMGYGLTCEAAQFHTKCIEENWAYQPTMGIVAILCEAQAAEIYQGRSNA